MNKNQEFLSNVIEASVRIALLACLTIWCFLIFSPFAIPTIWGIIIAVGLYPIFLKISSLFRGRKKLAAILLTIITIGVIFVPSYFLTDSFIGSGKKIVSNFMDGHFVVPQAPLSVNDWPFVGNAIYKMWDLAHSNLMAALSKLGPQLKPVGGFVLQGFANAGVSVVQFIIAIIIAGFIFVFGESGDGRKSIITRIGCNGMSVDVAGAECDGRRSCLLCRRELKSCYRKRTGHT